ncbi:MAG: type II toxin-antitoxin system HicB family antitoxin [Maricaulaceae bacterium]
MALYPIIAEYSPTDDAWTGFIPGVSGGVVGADTFFGLATAMRDVLETVEDLSDFDLDAPPNDAALEAGLAESAAGARMIWFDYTPKGRAKRISVTIHEGLLARIDRAAKTAGRSRSGWIAEMAEDRLSER